VTIVLIWCLQDGVSSFPSRSGSTGGLATIAEGSSSGKGAGENKLIPSPVGRSGATTTRRRQSAASWSYQTTESNESERNNSAVVGTAIERIEHALNLVKSLEASEGGIGAGEGPAATPIPTGKFTVPLLKGRAVVTIVSGGRSAALRDSLLQALRLLKRNARRGSTSSLDSSSFAQIVNMCDLDDVSRSELLTCYRYMWECVVVSCCPW
jgi:hypothetical protein